jgi:hypothetical protein
VRQISPRTRPGGTATGATSPGNTAEPSRELSKGDVVAVGEVPLAVASAGWTLVRSVLNEVRTHEHGTHPLHAPSHLRDAAGNTALFCPDQGATDDDRQAGQRDQC